MNHATKKDTMVRNLIIGAVVVAAATVGLLLAGGSGQPDGMASQRPASLVGQPAPDFSLTETNGAAVRLQDYRGKTLVVFFTEGLMCYPACWNQIAALGADPALNNDTVATVSVVNDSAAEWSTAMRKMPELASEKVLFDTDRRVSSAYDMLNQPSSMHRGERPGHTFVIIDKAGVVKFVEDDPQMGVRNAELRDKVKSLISQ